MWVITPEACLLLLCYLQNILKSIHIILNFSKTESLVQSLNWEKNSTGSQLQQVSSLYDVKLVENVNIIRISKII